MLLRYLRIVLISKHCYHGYSNDKNNNIIIIIIIKLTFWCVGYRIRMPTFSAYQKQ